MLDQLFNMVKDASKDHVENNQEVPNEKNKEVLGTITDTILTGLQGAVAAGGISQVLGLFSGKSSGSGLMGTITGSLSKNLEKLGLNAGIANTLSKAVVPLAIGVITKNLLDKNNNKVDANGLMGLLTRGNHEDKSALNGFDFQGLLQNIAGGNAKDDGFGLDDILGMVTNSASQNQNKYGGFMNLLKNVM